jgi:hypothetical protein
LALRLIGWLSLASIAVLSLLPADKVIRTRIAGDWSNHLEHVAAYAIGAAVMAFSYPRWPRTSILLGYILYAGSLEYLQQFSPGRSAQWVEFGFSAAGVVLGIAVVWSWQQSSETNWKRVPWREAVRANALVNALPMPVRSPQVPVDGRKPD